MKFHNFTLDKFQEEAIDAITNNYSVVVSAPTGSGKTLIADYIIHKNKDNELDFELYEVSVCHQCFFASARLEQFKVILPEGTIETTLTHKQKDRLTKKLSGRGKLLSDYQKSNAKSF